MSDDPAHVRLIKAELERVRHEILLLRAKEELLADLRMKLERLADAER